MSFTAAEVKHGLSWYHITAGSSWELSPFFKLVVSSKTFPILINGLGYRADYVDSNQHQNTGEGYWTEWMIFDIAGRLFKLELEYSSWDDGDEDCNIKVTEVQKTVKAITAYRQVPYEKEVTEYI